MSQDNIVDLSRKRKKIKPVTTSELFANIIAQMNRDKLASPGLPAFPQRFHILRDSAGRARFLEELANGVVAYRVDETITEAILGYCHSHLCHVPGADISYAQAEACRKLWAALTKPLDGEPTMMAEKSAGGLTFNRLSFDAPIIWDARIEDLAKEAPHFYDFIRRCSDGRAVCAFLGSLFFPDADRQQYLYLYGEGNDGKGALIRMLYALLKDAVQATEPKAAGDRFWNSKIYGKRLLMYTDCADPDHFTKASFKALIGDDPIYFEEKGKMGYTAIPRCKVLVASNLRPSISTQRSDMRRLLYVEVQTVPPANVVPQYEKYLIAEAEKIVTICKSIYFNLCHGGTSMCHGGTSIPPNQDMYCQIENLAVESEETAISVFHSIFEQCDDKNYTESAQDIRSALSGIGITNTYEIRRFKNVWERLFGVKVKRTHNNKIVYLGVKIK